MSKRNEKTDALPELAVECGTEGKPLSQVMGCLARLLVDLAVKDMEPTQRQSRAA